MSSGVLTFLFTDIEGSTRRREADAEAMRAALALHDDVMRGVIADCGGTVFKHTGDGVCAAFTSPRAAVDAAIATQRALRLPVRMGIATGEADSRDGDYFGAVLNRAARVMPAGHGGQILLDGITAGLVNGLDLVPRGTRRLRDLSQPVEMYQVAAPGLRDEFPPLNTLEATPGNLRRPTTSLVGRSREIAEIQQALTSHRMVTLTGSGGVGKTRLALEVAATLADGFVDGVWLIELAPVGEPASVPDAVAAVLGITQQRAMSTADSVAAALEGRSRLLVFDNCEHVLDAAADMVEAILGRSSTVRILATSREGLRIGDEQLMPVPPLDTSSGSAATTLFLERAHAIAPHASLGGAHDDDTVAEIVRRLDGIPLAIELAASRMQSMTITEVRNRLGDRFRLLVGSRRGLERHQTLGHAVQWSYDLLDDAEAALLVRCSVFAGGFDIEGARTVADGGDDFATLDLLDALVRKSLLVAEQSSGRTRYSMLETIRQFAEGQLAATGQAHEVRTSHAHYFAGLEAGVLHLWDGPLQRSAYEWLDLELANLRAAFRWAADNGALDDAAAIAFYSSFLGVWVEQHEPMAWVEELIQPAQGVEHRRLAHLYVMAAHCYAAGRLEDSLRYSYAARSILDDVRFDPVPYDFEVSIGGGATVMRLETEGWIRLCRSVIERDDQPHTFARSSLVLALTLLGSMAEAAAEARLLLVEADTTENPQLKSYALAAYGIAHRNGDFAGAFEVQRRALAIAQESGNRQTEHILAVSLARLTTLHGDDPAAALYFLTLAIRVRHDAGSFSLLHPPLAILATFLDRLGRCAPAAVLFGFAVTPLIHVFYPETALAITHLREALGTNEYEDLARSGRSMTAPEMVAYAFDQIDRARGELG